MQLISFLYHIRPCHEKKSAAVPARDLFKRRRATKKARRDDSGLPL